MKQIPGHLWRHRALWDQRVPIYQLVWLDRIWVGTRWEARFWRPILWTAVKLTRLWGWICLKSGLIKEAEIIPGVSWFWNRWER